MSAAHVRRGASARAKPRKSSGNSVSKRIAKTLPVDQKRANRIAGLAFTGFLLAIRWGTRAAGLRALTRVGAPRRT